MARVLAWAVVFLCVVWATGALWFDAPIPSVPRQGFAIVFFLAAGLAPMLVPGFWRRAGLRIAGFGVVLCWWLTLEPSNDRPWAPETERTASAEIQGDDVSVSNVRNFDYRTTTEFTPRWETRRVQLSHLTGADLFINFWGSKYMAHPIASFQFSDAPPLCFSIEIRQEKGKTYNPLAAFYRQYELIYIVADERDVVRLRSNYRKEDVYLYRTRLPTEEARVRFLEYLRSVNDLQMRPRWYNVVTANCTTSIRTQHARGKRAPWDWRMLLNGAADEMLYQRGALVTDGLPFDELKRRALITEAAQAADADPDFSARIRQGRPGFPKAPGATPDASANGGSADGK